MAHARPSCQAALRLATPAIDRRHFLHTGVAIVVPLVAGTTLGRAASAWPIVAPAQEPEADAILGHIHGELLKVGRGMRGVEGVKGEHVRALAANLDLMGAHLLEKGHERRLQAELKEGISRSGRDGFAQELFTRQVEVIAATAGQQGIVSRVRLDLLETGAALDLAQRQGFAPAFRKSAPALARLAVAFDRARQHQGTVLRAAAQKPGDDIGGAWYDAPPLTCGNLKFMIHMYAAAGGLMALIGLPESGIICAIIAECLSMIYDAACTA